MGPARLRGVCLGLVCAVSLAAAAADSKQPSSWAPPSAASQSGGQALAKASPAGRQIIEWVRTSHDNEQLPFIVVDKRQAHAFAFDAAGRLRGSAPVLMGAALGDLSVPGIGERPLASIRPQERTTPAGRFLAEMGRNAHGEDILWVDYDAAVSLHRVRATNPAERRLQRLASPTPDDNRISYGCINVPRGFYEQVVLPLLRSPAAAGHAIVYVMPEVLPVTTVFPRLGMRAVARGEAPA